MNSDMNIGQFLTKRAELNTQQEYIYDIHAQRRLTFSELNRRANKIAHALAGLGLQHGDRVALLAHNGYQFVESFFGAAKPGFVVMPLNWRLTADELAFILKDGGAKALIFDEAFAETVCQLRERRDEVPSIEHWITVGDEVPDFATPYELFIDGHSEVEPAQIADAGDNLFIMYTSGTTGLPKGVVHTHETMFWAVINLLVTSDNQTDDRYLVMLPMFHVAALGPTIGSTYRGNTIVIMREPNPATIWEVIEKEQINTSLAVPALLNFMLQVPERSQYDHSSMRCMITGAAPASTATLQAYIDLGIEIHQAYGLTENCGCGCLITGKDSLERVGSTGKAFVHAEVRIVNEEGATQPAGVAGEVLIRGRHVMKEYWNRPDATAETLRDGWLYTGDIAIADEDGFITICDRKKDMIISGGENIYPAEIEAILIQHPDVLDAAVIGEPSEKWGESPLAVVVGKDGGPSEEAVLSFCAGKLARYKQPARIEVVDVIPRNPSGKILKRVLRDTLLGAAS
ncbi:MAG: long-chain-fatty-acid--CoA ligase [Pseudomonadota bacterium]